ncbi:hypothetical protein BD324DRAFT_98394 [Kockovaella imperatae]|uniref:Uncharacterized protein n=1 Tax=Kockovaella imperatae TaxID=4999 RepID=A0A1Y1UD18_9TREE|nr:hypothetical protein BD324DRAFT_98394 [Kockovaella imperatae]ORX35437.1 hypothetical protein BD324DRAFT_98394 [Kockovaella imperatae]
MSGYPSGRPAYYGMHHGEEASSSLRILENQEPPHSFGDWSLPTSVPRAEGSSSRRNTSRRDYAAQASHMMKAHKARRSLDRISKPTVVTGSGRGANFEHLERYLGYDLPPEVPEAPPRALSEETETIQSSSWVSPEQGDMSASSDLLSAGMQAMDISTGREDTANDDERRKARQRLVRMGLCKPLEKVGSPSSVRSGRRSKSGGTSERSATYIPSGLSKVSSTE